MNEKLLLRAWIDLESSPDTGARGDYVQSGPDQFPQVTGFAAGTLITTLCGKIPVERLRKGDMLLTRDRGFQPLRKRVIFRFGLTDPLSRTFSQPILIPADAMGPGQPVRDLVLAPHHRILSRDQIILYNESESEALVEARALAEYSGISAVATEPTPLFSLLLDEHEVILAKNCWSESLHTPREPTGLPAPVNSASGLAEIARATGNAPVLAKGTARICMSEADLPVLRRA